MEVNSAGVFSYAKVFTETMNQLSLWVIGQNVLVKTATNVEISMGVAVLSCFRQLRGWTKCVGKTSKIG